jgi:ubiquinone/menaquinone biosynthesis C-methylase UbiE
MTMSSTPTRAAQSQLMSLLTAKWAPPIVGVLAELRVADHLIDEPKTPQALAGSVGAHPTALRRVLRAAASLGVFAEDDHGRFALTPMAQWLRSDVPGSLQPAAVLFTLEPFWTPYAQIKHSVLTGEPAFDTVYGTTIYKYFAEHPEQAALFGATAASFHAQGIADIAATHDFARYETVVDVGGGNGALLATILKANPGVRGVLFDQPDVIEQARTAATFDGLTDRVQFVAGDFFQSVPGGDALLIKSCLHNFGDEQVIQILQAIRRAMPSHATLLVAETVVPTGNGPHYAKLDDIEMLVIAGGADRDEREYSQLLAAGGFDVQQISNCGERFSLIQAQPSTQPQQTP